MCGPGPKEALDDAFELRGGSPGVRGVQKRRSGGPGMGTENIAKKVPPRHVLHNQWLEMM